jgi:hypothetical protein
MIYARSQNYHPHTRMAASQPLSGIKLGFYMAICGDTSPHRWLFPPPFRPFGALSEKRTLLDGAMLLSVQIQAASPLTPSVNARSGATTVDSRPSGVSASHHGVLPACHPPETSSIHMPGFHSYICARAPKNCTHIFLHQNVGRILEGEQAPTDCAASQSSCRSAGSSWST